MIQQFTANVTPEIAVSIGVIMAHRRKANITVPVLLGSTYMFQNLIAAVAVTIVVQILAVVYLPFTA
jgi:hypothetical protein